MISVPSAVGNALANATGVEFFELPLDPERIYLTLKRAARTETAAAAPAAPVAAPAVTARSAAPAAVAPAAIPLAAK
jgi:hypothetical protein